MPTPRWNTDYSTAQRSLTDRSLLDAAAGTGGYGQGTGIPYRVGACRQLDCILMFSVLRSPCFATDRCHTGCHTDRTHVCGHATHTAATNGSLPLHA